MQVSLVIVSDGLEVTLTAGLELLPEVHAHHDLVLVVLVDSVRLFHGSPKCQWITSMELFIRWSSLDRVHRLSTQSTIHIVVELGLVVDYLV